MRGLLVWTAILDPNRGPGGDPSSGPLFPGTRPALGRRTLRVPHYHQFGPAIRDPGSRVPGAENAGMLPMPRSAAVLAPSARRCLGQLEYRNALGLPSRLPPRNRRATRKAVEPLRPGARKATMKRAGFGAGPSRNVAPRVGIEPTTTRLTVACSTAELPGIGKLMILAFFDSLSKPQTSFSDGSRCRRP